MVGATLPGDWHLGIVGGSGLYDLELDEAQDLHVSSPFGQASGPVTMGLLGGVRVSFLARHGAGHALDPSAVNYRANIDVLKRCGVTDVLAICAVGSLREALAPGDFVAVEQIIDQTQGRERSFFGPGIVAHVGLADPICPRLARRLAAAGEAAGVRVHGGGCYVAIEGPQFSTRAESRMYREWGGDVIGMTAMPEARLAREAELPYAILATVADYDPCVERSPADGSEMIEVMRANAAAARQVLQHLVAALPHHRARNPIDSALNGAIATPRAEWNPLMRVKLDAVARRILRKVPGG
jgi:5'-methylthioadenosine phosphorylase